MVFLHILNNPRKSMQRLGFLKYLIWQASLARTNSLRTLGNKLIDAVSRKVPVSLTPDLKDYVRHVLTESKYKDLRLAALKETNGACKDEGKIEIEIQDYYLSKSDLPSRRGKLVSDDWNRYSQLALDLHFLRPGSYSIMTRGHSFLSLVSDEERKSFDIHAPNTPYTTNPLYLSSPQKLLLLFSLVEADGDLLRRLYKILLTRNDSFTAIEVGNYLPDIYRMTAKESRNRVRSGDDSIRIQRLLDTADKIEAVKRNPNPGGKNPREHGITVRLEPFVDLSLLHKPDPLSSSYEIRKATRSYFEPLIESESVESFLNSRFFGTVNKSLNFDGMHKVDANSCLSNLQKAYNVLKSPVGYAPITELSLLAGIYSLTEMGTFFEISECIDILKALQKEKPRQVLFNVDRWGMLNFVKFN